jgi:hypothetical protein
MPLDFGGATDFSDTGAEFHNPIQTKNENGQIKKPPAFENAGGQIGAEILLP